MIPAKLLHTEAPLGNRVSRASIGLGFEAFVQQFND
jgi:hypothetical protein